MGARKIPVDVIGLSPELFARSCRDNAFRPSPLLPCHHPGRIWVPLRMEVLAGPR